MIQVFDLRIPRGTLPGNYLCGESTVWPQNTLWLLLQASSKWSSWPRTKKVWVEPFPKCALPVLSVMCDVSRWVVARIYHHEKTMQNAFVAVLFCHVLVDFMKVTGLDQECVDVEPGSIKEATTIAWILMFNKIAQKCWPGVCANGDSVDLCEWWMFCIRVEGWQFGSAFFSFSLPHLLLWFFRPPEVVHICVPFFQRIAACYHLVSALSRVLLRSSHPKVVEWHANEQQTPSQNRFEYNSYA